MIYKEIVLDRNNEYYQELKAYLPFIIGELTESDYISNSVTTAFVDFLSYRLLVVEVVNKYEYYG